MGLKDTDGDGVLEDSEGHKLEFNVYVNSTNSQRVGTAAFLTKNLQDAGIKLNTQPVTLGTINDQITKFFSFDAVVLGWQGGVPPGPTNNKNILLSSGM